MSTLSYVWRKREFLLRRAVASYPKRVECNVCGGRARYFNGDAWHAETICWQCGSDVRHRLLVAAFTSIDRLSFERLVSGKSVLHFASEHYIGLLLKKYARRYLTADLTSKRADLRLDISSMPGVESDTYDLVLASDVLEHVPQDIRAMREIYRVLRARGHAILTVPQKDNLAETNEDASIETPEERERAYGQSDHLRIYGDDFPRRLAAAGFQEITVIDARSFPEELVKRHVLFPPRLSDRPLATNYRKIYFARKLPDGS
jgi:SAM-dependent methyltransferase